MPRVWPEDIAVQPLQQAREDGARAGLDPGGIFVAIAGPSGAGKDSLIAAARTGLAADPRYHFVRRVVTRAADHSEDHDSLSEPEFRFRAETGGFALWWQANNLFYGLPAQMLDDLRRGHVVVANISRDVIDLARHRFPRSLIVHVKASPEVLSRRLAARGREQAADQTDRLARSMLREQAVEADVSIENDGDLAKAVEMFTSVLRALLPPACPCPPER